MSELPPYFIDPVAWAEPIADRAVEHGRRAVIIGDVCDTILDARASWYQHYKNAATKLGHPIATPEAFDADGWRHYLDHPDITPDYNQLKTELMHDVAFHTGMSVVKASVELAEWGKAYGLLDGYCSTRPEVLGEVTAQDLREYGFRTAPLLVRGKSIPFDQTIGFKGSGLNVLRDALDARGLEAVKVVLVDDFGGLVTEINKSPRNITAVHFTEQSSWPAIVWEHAGISIDY